MAVNGDHAPGFRVSRLSGNNVTLGGNATFIAAVGAGGDLPVGPAAEEAAVMSSILPIAGAFASYILPPANTTDLLTDPKQLFIWNTGSSGSSALRRR